MKKLAYLVLALMLMLCTVSVATAEESVLLWDADGIERMSPETDVVKVRVNTDWLYGLVSLNGEVLVQPEYGYLNSVDATKAPGYYLVAKENSLNNLMVIDRTGNVITFDTYGDIDAISEKWMICAVLSETQSEDYDYGSWTSDKKYVAERYDLYYLPAASCVGQLTREQFERAEDIGDYLLVQDDANVVRVYDVKFQEVETQQKFNSVYDCEYVITAKGLSSDTIISRITGETIATGYTSVSNCSDELLMVTAKRGNKGLMDHQGNLVLAADYDYVTYNSSLDLYALEIDGLYGIYDPAANAVLSCAYTDVLAKTVVGDTTYYCVEIDGKVGYVNQKGEVTCAIVLEKESVSVVGCSILYVDNTGAGKLITADGMTTVLEGVTEAYSEKATQGRYICVKNADGEWGVMNWRGQQIVDFCRDSSYAFSFVDQTHFILDGNCMYELQ